MTAYYNEIDPFAAAWLREAIKGNKVATTALARGKGAQDAI